MPEQEVDTAEVQTEDTQPEGGFFSAAMDALNGEQEGQSEMVGEEPVAEEQPISSDVDEPKQDLPEAVEPAEAVADEQGETEEPEASEETDDVPDKENPDRFQYWQSKAQKYESQFGDLDEDVVNLANNIQQNPEILSAVEQAINGGGKQQPKSPSNEVKEQDTGELVRPERPVKPSGYNRMDAVSDPESESAKYEDALIEYQEGLTDYLEQKEKRKEQERKRKKELSEKQQAVEAEKQKIATELQQGYGYTAEQSQDFIQFLENQPNNLDSYRKLYEASKGIGEFAKPTKPKRKPQNQTQKSNSNPLPAGIGGSAPKPVEDSGGFFG